MNEGLIQDLSTIIAELNIRRAYGSHPTQEKNRFKWYMRVISEAMEIIKSHSSGERRMVRKYWFPAVICPKSLDEDDLTKMRSPTLACPKCEHYGGTNMEEKGAFILCNYRTSGETANE